MRIGYSKQFKKQYKKLHKNNRDKFVVKLNLLLKNPNNPALSLHKLHGKLKNHMSINVTGDIRAVFVYISSYTIDFVAIGSHSDLYS